MMAKQIMLSLFLILCILEICYGYYWYWYTTDRMKTKITFMTRELIKEAIRNFQRIDHIKEYYKSSVVWDIGQMLFYIRSKFARLVRLYILSIENNDKFKNFHLHMPTLKEMHHLGMYIYNLVEMLEEYDLTVDLNPPVRIPKKKRKPDNISSFIDPNIKGGNPPKPNNLLRKRPIDIASFKNEGFNARKPNSALRNRMIANRQRDVDANFESDIE